MEILDIVDAAGHPTGETVERSEAHWNGIRHRTAHVWLLRNKNGRTEILLQQRSLTKASFPGCYDISSAGHIPAGCDYVESAVRELREELGIAVRPEELRFCGSRTVIWDTCFNGVPFHDRQFSNVYAVWKDIEPEAFVLQETEVDGVRWMAFDECVEAVKTNRIRHCIAPEELTMVKSAMEGDFSHADS